MASSTSFPPGAVCVDQVRPPSVVDRSSGALPEAVPPPAARQWLSEEQSRLIPETPGNICCTVHDDPPLEVTRMALSSPLVPAAALAQQCVASAHDTLSTEVSVGPV
jgi:hypothetical protein